MNHTLRMKSALIYGIIHPFQKYVKMGNTNTVELLLSL